MSDSPKTDKLNDSLTGYDDDACYVAMRDLAQNLETALTEAQARIKELEARQTLVMDKLIEKMPHLI